MPPLTARPCLRVYPRPSPVCVKPFSWPSNLHSVSQATEGPLLHRRRSCDLWPLQAPGEQSSTPEAQRELSGYSIVSVSVPTSGIKPHIMVFNTMFSFITSFIPTSYIPEWFTLDANPVTCLLQGELFILTLTSHNAAVFSVLNMCVCVCVCVLQD